MKPGAGIRPATFINRPLSRNQLRKKMMRPLRKKDIDHYNTPLLAKFLNDVGRLYNRYQTRLPIRLGSASRLRLRRE